MPEPDRAATLPDEALVWRPDAENTNSLAVLAAHSISATRFWLANGAGVGKSIEEYRRVDRGPAFDAGKGAVSDFPAQFDAMLSGVATLFAAGTEAHLLAEVAQPADPAMTRTGVGCLIHRIGHLREHVGQAQLMRDLWLGRGV